MIKKDKKLIVKSLNSLFNSYEKLSIFCDNVNNDIDLVILNINKLIKSAFVNPDIITRDGILEILPCDLKDADEKYIEYLNSSKKKNLLSFLKDREHRKNSFGFPLDSDIRLEDIEGLKIPSIERLKQICALNLSQIRSEEEKTKKKNEYYKQLREFDETAFTYTRFDLITIDQSFIYYNSDLIGDIYPDYDTLYNSERYKDKSTSPLNDSFSVNIAKIIKSNDICVKKIGKVYEIENGRHRIIYILKNRQSAQIPVKVTRRFEDRKINIILIELIKNYNIGVYKNNLLNDEPNILLVLEGKAYEIKTKEDLQTFYNNLKNKTSIDNFFAFPFSINPDVNRKELIDQYSLLIFEKYLSDGDKILTNNFTDIVKLFGDVNYKIFYETYMFLQNSYQRSLIFKQDFRRNPGLISFFPGYNQELVIDKKK